MARVLLDFRIDDGGVGRYGRDLVQGLRELAGGPKVEVLRRGRGLGKARIQPFTPWGRRAVASRASKTSADLIHGLHLELPASDLPMVVTIQDLRPLDFPGQMRPHRRLPLKAIVKRSMERADKIIVPSYMTAESVERHGGRAAAEKVALVPLGVSEAFTPLSEEEKEQARVRFAGGSRYVAGIFHHAFRPHKNFEAFVATASAALDKPPASHLRFVAAGTGSASGPIRFTGQLSDRDLRLFYGGAEVLLLTSRVEGFGFPVVESLACGTSVVCSARVGVLGYLERGYRTADVDDPAALLAAILASGDETPISLDLDAAGLTVAHMASGTADIYSSLLL